MENHVEHLNEFNHAAFNWSICVVAWLVLAAITNKSAILKRMYQMEFVYSKVWLTSHWCYATNYSSEK